MNNLPLPTPNSGEAEKDFIARCMSTDVMTTEFPEQKQRLAVCYSQFRRKQKGLILRTVGSFQLRKLSDDQRVIAGYASIPIIDDDGDLITLEALQDWWSKFIHSEYSIITLTHDDIPIGRVLPEYTDQFGTIHKSGVDTNGLYVVSELRKDTKTADEVWSQIEQWGGKGAYSISANVFNDPKVEFTAEGKMYRRYGPGDGELNSITIGREGANAPSVFQIVKLKKKPVLRLHRKLKVVKRNA